MNYFAHIFNSRVVEIIPALDDDGRAIDLRYTTEFVANCVAIPDGATVAEGYLYDGFSFSEPEEPGPPDESLRTAVRAQRDYLLRSIYDTGILMALRSLRMAATPEESSLASAKVAELDAYAEALQAVPEQPGFPQEVEWPEAPTK